MRPLPARVLRACCFLLQVKSLFEFVLFQIGTDYAQPSRILRAALANLVLAGRQVKIQPGAVRRRQHPLGSQNRPVKRRVRQILQQSFQLGPLIFVRRFRAPACKDLVGMVMMAPVVVAAAGTAVTVVMAVLVLVVVFMFVTAAGAVAMVVMAVLVSTFMPVRAAGVVIAVVVVMAVLVSVLMLVTAAGAVITVVMVVTMLMSVLMLMTAAGAVITVVMVVTTLMSMLMSVLMLMGMLLLPHKLCQHFIGQALSLLHRLANLRPG